MTAVDQLRGSFQYPQFEGDFPPSAPQEMERAVEILQDHKDAWVAVAPRSRVALIDELIRDYSAIVPRLVEAEVTAKDLRDSDFGIGQEFLNQSVVLRYLRGLRHAIEDIQTFGHPRIPGPVSTRSGGQVVARIFPDTGYDRLLFGGYSMEVWMEPGVMLADLGRTQARAYADKNHSGRVALVLGAGNISALAVTDVLYKLFVEDQVVLLKLNPVNAYTGPLIAEGLRALVQAGFVRLAYGGPAEGSYLCRHPGVDAIHMTGSDKTFDAIVFGSGAEGAERKASSRPLLTKPVTAELGCVTPVIVVPGSWTSGEIHYQAEKLASWLANNTGFTCGTPHMLLLHAQWPQRRQFLDALRHQLSEVPLRRAYYPGAPQIRARFVAAHPEAEEFGRPAAGEMPWTLIPSVPANGRDEICFNQEAFCGLLAETPIEAADAAEFLDRATAFANQRLWGTLGATLFVQPASLKQAGLAAAVDRAIANLRYGVVSVNVAVVGVYFLAMAPWGSFPGQEIANVQSGLGWVHNSLMFSRPQKVVLRAPFMESPPSPFLASRARVGRKLAPRLVALEAAPSPWKIPGLLWAAMGG